MSPEAQRIAIAEVCGWMVFPDNPMGEPHTGLCGTPDGSSEKLQPLPNYLNDLNAMHEVEKTLVNRKTLARAYTNTYGELLFQSVMSPGHCLPWHTTAAQRAEAFLKTIGKWEET